MYFDFAQYKQKGFAGILVLIVVVIAAALGGAYYFGVQKGGTSSSSPSPSVAADETTNWKTYTNTKYGFSLKLPVNHFPHECQTVEDYSVLINTDPPQQDPDLYCASDAVRSEMEIIVGNEDKKKFELESLKVNYSLQEKSIVVSGINGTQVVGEALPYEDGPPPAKHIISSLFERNNRFYFLQHDSDDNVQRNLYDQILSTFRFPQ